ncbi:MAG TPA: hypothetical protein VEJ67_05955 [Candidatus Cybelea sp.]|nr:hypothetical protein [Candidatus Cybelea sp.]
MSQRVKLYVLVALLAIAAAIFLHSRSDVPGFQGVLASDAKFTPLDIQEPDLRLDLLDQIHRSEYRGSHRDIFTGEPLLAPSPSRGPVAVVPKVVGDPYPKPAPPPPPLQVPAQFFGYATRPGTERRVAFFLNGDDVVVAAEGDTFMGSFRLVHIGNDSAEVEEISSGRRATLPLEHPADEEAVNP